MGMISMTVLVIVLALALAAGVMYLYRRETPRDREIKRDPASRGDIRPVP